MNVSVKRNSVLFARVFFVFFFLVIGETGLSLVLKCNVAEEKRGSFRVAHTVRSHSNLIFQYGETYQQKKRKKSNTSCVSTLSTFV